MKLRAEKGLFWIHRLIALKKLPFVGSPLPPSTNPNTACLSTRFAHRSFGKTFFAIGTLLSFVKTFRYIGISKKLAIFTETINQAAKDVTLLMIIFAILITGFSVGFHIGEASEERAQTLQSSCTSNSFFTPLARRSVRELYTGVHELSLFSLVAPAPIFGRLRRRQAATGESVTWHDSIHYVRRHYGLRAAHNDAQDRR